MRPGCYVPWLLARLLSTVAPHAPGRDAAAPGPPVITYADG
jgi:hypothetical protein